MVDDQRSVKIHVLQGESKVARENVSLGDFELSNIQPAPKGEPRIRVKFGLDANGIVSVSAKDVRTGIQEEITIDNPTGLSKQELEQMRDDAERGKVESDQSREVKTIRREIEQKLVTLETFLRDHRGELHKADIGGLESALKRGRMALLKSNDLTNLTDLSGYLSRFHAHLSEKVGV